MEEWSHVPRKNERTRDAEWRGTRRHASTRVQARGMLAVYYCAETTPNDCRAAVAAAAACRPTRRPHLAASRRCEPHHRCPKAVSGESTEKWVEKLYGV
ncbi:hypothetical protein K0M31_018539 [Melipona bicolor]|uniref:Uncharacterized protein n=1 Tax=Melipona bicolor TaxID=60889 RepID=A0AA40G3L7_9HYME|nr:hypothetical protein K0M31_018539 [Melipona bicolor]